MCAEMFHDQHQWRIFRWNFIPVTVVRHCIRRQCYILLPNVWVVFKIYFAILHNIVARNNIQHSIWLNRQKEKEEVFTSLHYICLVMLHIWVICFEHRDAVTWKVCGYIFEDCKRHNVQHKFNVLHIYIYIYINLVKSYGYTMIFILIYAKSFKSIWL